MSRRLAGYGINIVAVVVVCVLYIFGMHGDKCTNLNSIAHAIAVLQ